MVAQQVKPDIAGLAYGRVLLKISGEALMGEQTYGIDVNVARTVAEELKAVHELGVQVAVVVGRQYLPRSLQKCRQHGPFISRLYWDAGHGNERRGIAGCARKA